VREKNDSTTVIIVNRLLVQRNLAGCDSEALKKASAPSADLDQKFHEGLGLGGAFRLGPLTY